MLANYVPLYDNFHDALSALDTHQATSMYSEIYNSKVPRSCDVLRNHEFIIKVPSSWTDKADRTEEQIKELILKSIDSITLIFMSDREEVVLTSTQDMCLKVSKCFSDNSNTYAVSSSLSFEIPLLAIQYSYILYSIALRTQSGAQSGAQKDLPMNNISVLGQRHLCMFYNTDDRKKIVRNTKEFGPGLMINDGHVRRAAV